MFHARADYRITNPYWKGLQLRRVLAESHSLDPDPFRVKIVYEEECKLMQWRPGRPTETLRKCAQFRAPWIGSESRR